MLVDERNITIAGGKGGDGILHWLRLKYFAKGGPDGGNGGNGGNAYVVAIRDINALSNYRENEVLQAERGGNGAGALRNGKNGNDLEVHLPIGSILTNKETLERFELLEVGQRILVATGGRGGLGNAHFKSSINTTPQIARPGEQPQSYPFHIELNIIADVGIIGLPSAGKSTLLNMLTNAGAKVGAYPFTTLEPNLGVFHSYVLADIPGLIEKASEGKGLGHKFLKHIRRTKMLLHLVSAEEENVGEAYATIRNELASFDPTLLEKEEMVVLSKVDVVDETAKEKILAQLPNGTLPLSVIDDTLLKQFSTHLSRQLAKG